MSPPSSGLKSKPINKKGVYTKDRTAASCWFPHRTTRNYIPEDIIRHINRCEKLRSYIEGMDKIVETLRNLGIEFVLATLK
jgi:hypothetical protein